MTDCSNFRDVI